jgi:hypothetical protein
MFARQEFQLPFRTYRINFETGAAKDLYTSQPSSERPIVRGIARYHESSSGGMYIEEHQNGLVDVWNFYSSGIPQRNKPTIYHGWLLGCVGNVLALLDNHRKIAGTPSAEYALETEITRFPMMGLPEHPLVYEDLNEFGEYLLTTFPVILPRLTVGDRSEFDQIMNVIDTDIFDLLGCRQAPQPFKVGW